jgi:hypothetical protein
MTPPLLARIAGDGKTKALMKKVLSLPESDLSGCFVVVTETAIRISGVITD